jgi:hypothetical protein
VWSGHSCPLPLTLILIAGCPARCVFLQGAEPAGSILNLALSTGSRDYVFMKWRGSDKKVALQLEVNLGEHFKDGAGGYLREFLRLYLMQASAIHTAF